MKSRLEKRKMDTNLILMVIGSHIVLGILLAAIGFEYLAEAYTAMSAPLWVGVLTLAKIDACYKTDPGKITSFMTKAFFFKVIFYGMFIVAVISFSTFNTVSFVSIFTGFFIALLGVEAAFLRSLFKDKTQ